jgi:hypothetical protein
MYIYIYIYIYVYMFMYILISTIYTYKNLDFYYSKGTGLSSTQKIICNGFLYIPQYGLGGTGSLNVSVASTIVFHRYYIWVKSL